MDSKFKVCISRKGGVMFSVGGGFVIFLLSLPNPNKAIELLSTITAIVLFFFICLVVTGTMLFHVKVNNSTINIRTKLGRKYNFYCSEIDKITCSDLWGGKYGPNRSITLITKSHKLDIEHHMNGFKKMAGYILERCENGEIKETAVSKGCKRKLTQFRDGTVPEIRKKGLRILDDDEKLPRT